MAPLANQFVPAEKLTLRHTSQPHPLTRSLVSRFRRW